MREELDQISTTYWPAHDVYVNGLRCYRWFRISWNVHCSSPHTPSVIYQIAAIICFWERRSYCWDASYDINVAGLENVLTAVKALTSALLIYTSTADTVIRRPKFMRLGWDLDKAPRAVSDSDAPLSPAHLSDSCYARTKLLAEQLVIKADGIGGLRSGIIRPGFTIIGPNDHKECSARNIGVWDPAAAHLLLEDALTRDIKEARGQAFLSQAIIPLGRYGTPVKQSKTVMLDDVPSLLIFVLAHLVEAFLFVRFHVLLLLCSPLGFPPRLVPKWIGELVYVQPATLEYRPNNVTIDDSRARKILGIGHHGTMLSVFDMPLKRLSRVGREELMAYN
ncbi:putative 3-beta hydroxysteroid dehydrogenase/isomerase family protein [Lyophyllum shimeji]|uniref:3-beta hydroxysteroid dehydrogenase/isomerase family protein n=1 Tax=Lyophyllum shimeji TaxID=47721 RepID=A0A9P3UMM3_LYOSH|nr:putative 3-beta hydroxysteroid dehydrogenase/isomerase family protein [Lyophyllum shimeji]